MMLSKKFLIILTVFVFLTFSGVKSAPRAITQKDILQSQQLKNHLETLKGHLQDTIEKIDHNIRARQADIEAEVQTPDDEYLEAALGSQRNNFLGAAAIPQIPLPVQNVRKSQNSGLRR